MTKLEKVLYTARAHTTGGRDGGASRTDDGRPQVSGQYSHRILKSIGHNLPQEAPREFAQAVIDVDGY